MAKLAAIRDPNRFKVSPPCPKCDGAARVDWIDLVKGTSAHSCRVCGYYWVDFQARAAEQAP